MKLKKKYMKGKNKKISLISPQQLQSQKRQFENVFGF